MTGIGFSRELQGGFCDGEVFCVGRAGFFAIVGASLFATATAAATTSTTQSRAWTSHGMPVLQAVFRTCCALWE